MDLNAENVTALLKPFVNLRALRWEHVFNDDDPGHNVAALVQRISDAVGTTLEKLSIHSRSSVLLEEDAGPRSVAIQGFKTLKRFNLDSAFLLIFNNTALREWIFNNVPHDASIDDLIGRIMPMLDESAREQRLPRLIDMLSTTIEYVKVIIPAWMTEEMSLLEGIVEGKATNAPHLKELKFVYDGRYPPYSQRSQHYIAEVESKLREVNVRFTAEEDSWGLMDGTEGN
jgi:hypothetical protein